MSIRDSLLHVLSHYSQARTEDFTAHPLAQYIRGELRDAIANAAGDTDRLIFKGSAGQGNWAKGPWVGIFDRLVTSSAQSGYYPVYLFREDMAGVYLSLNQGMTEAKKLYKADAKTALQARAGNFRAMLGNETAHFPELIIDLAPDSPANDTAFYEAANICAKYYPVGALPNEQKLIQDLSNMLYLYEALIQGETSSSISGPSEGDEPPEMHVEDATRFKLHKRIERNPKLAQKAKELLGCTCQVCGTNFKERYGSIGEGFIEAHHLKPLASLKGKKVAMDPAKDFAVLCSNCHRMVHRSGCVDDIETFKTLHFCG